MRAYRRKPDDNGVITVLAFNVFGLSVAVAALIWSLKIGLYGIAVSPWPN